MSNSCRGCVRAGVKQERDTCVRGEFLPIPMMCCYKCIRNPKVRQKKGSSIRHMKKVDDYYLSKEDMIHEMARRRGMGAVCDDGNDSGYYLGHNTKPSYTKRDRKYLEKKGG